jgi:Rps23 Pro-64 3,4-dihydroxylase Tpa1-like proline 4-hydroxylase
MIDLKSEWFKSYKMSRPFNHVVIDDFLDEDIAIALEKGFFDYASPKWHCYSNAIEEKKTCNVWNEFNADLYSYFSAVNSPEFVSQLSRLVGVKLFADHGLHGGGLHIHSSGGNLNPHLDYSIHPKLRLQRKINIIYYCSSDSRLALGGFGDLGFWSGDVSTPRELEKTISPKFNRAVIFDTSQNSWHGLVKPIPAGFNVLRKSLATYYLIEADEGCDPRTRAKFSPRSDQVENDVVIDTIVKRSMESTYSEVYVVDDKK